ncbi:MAG: hypothetical protein Q8M09_08190 [Pseudomonadota bacterium]|nr:hypothetical protein [Pseudomonadota bacterium]MDP1904208.1 hypothetical protein [Pseudomonadota bacterium]
MKAHIITWALSVLAACIIGAAWVYTHPSPRVVTVDLKSLFDDEARAFANKARGTPEEQVAALSQVKKRGEEIESAIDRLAQECRCAVLNSAAIAKLPPNPTDAGIPDMTGRVRQMLAGGK